MSNCGNQRWIDREDGSSSRQINIRRQNSRNHRSSASGKKRISTITIRARWDSLLVRTEEASKAPDLKQEQEDHSRGGYLVYDPILDAVGVRFSENDTQIWDVPLVDTDPPNHHILHVSTGKYLAPNTNRSDSNRVILSDAPYGWIPWFSSYGVRMSADHGSIEKMDLRAVKSTSDAKTAEITVQVPMEEKDIDDHYQSALDSLLVRTEEASKAPDLKQEQEDYYKEFRTRLVVLWCATNRGTIRMVSILPSLITTTPTGSEERLFLDRLEPDGPSSQVKKGHPAHQ
ncbi:MAG: hypothetical protein J3Q66DRAFT_405245 [Benniella sp.]|nr:MAG: hypothetical protein J3Q66DRAFT_405245 [Benniella sp.]